MGPDAITRPERVLYTAPLIADADRAIAPGAILIDATPIGPSAPTLRILAVGSPADVAAHPAAHAARRVDLPTHAILPAFVNAHTHLDLTHIGYVPPVADPARRFLSFIDVVRQRRVTDDPAIRASVEAGVRASLASGVIAVGDIAGAATARPNLAACRALADSPLGGVSFLEFFAIGAREDASRDLAHAALNEGRADNSLRRVLGLSPHATNSVGPSTLRWALDLARDDASRGTPLPLCTHVAETIPERDLIARATGPNRAFLDLLGLWNSRLEQEFGQGRSPIAHFAWALGASASSAPKGPRPTWVLAHCNDASDADLDLLAGLVKNGIDLSVAYCPRASDYFAAPDQLGPHRYREMMARGINVALGTDSLINLPPLPAADATRFSPLWDARLLHHRDHVDAHTLLAMITTRGARALALNDASFTIWRSHESGAPIAGIAGVPLGPTAHAATATGLLASVFNGITPPELLLAGKKCGHAEQ